MSRLRALPLLLLLLLVLLLPAHGLRRHVLRASLSDARELTKIFNRVADKYLLLDVPGAGTPGMINCCHGGCDNCAFSHVFDEMSSGRAKWVALYPYRQHTDGRDHSAPWSRLFFDATSAPTLRLSKTEFCERFASLPCLPMSMGPPASVPPDEPLEPDTLEQLWRALQRGLQSKGGDGGDDEHLGADDFARALASLTGAEHGAIYSEFARLGQNV